MACRFPGSANLDAYWDLLLSGREAIGDIPPNRYLDLDELVDRKTGKVRKITTARGGYLDDIDRFDPYVFQISPRDARLIDPQQRLLLETAWEALEDAGQDLRALAGSRTGVFTGIWTSDYETRAFASARQAEATMTVGGGRYSAAGRLSFVFDFRGPSFVVDTACSSSLVSTHLACQALLEGECDMALATGVNLILLSNHTRSFSTANLLAPDGRCKFGDASANGFVRSEGVGVVILKTLSKALADGDRIHAVLRGSAVNNNGQASGLLMAPGQEAQMQLLRDALHRSGIKPAEVDYVEAHGTGTKAGDPMEIKALGRILSEGRSPDAPPCLIGSVKTNIGHTESAAGIAGLIKTVLCVKHRVVPASLHFHNPDPQVPWDSLKIKVVTENTKLRSDGRPLLAGVNSFGVTGTFAHVLVEEFRAASHHRDDLKTPATEVGSELYLLPISARSEPSLRQLALRFADRLEQSPHDAGLLHDLCYSASLRRTHHEFRKALVARERGPLIEELRSFGAGETASTQGGQRGSTLNVGFVFSGQGPQWAGMGAQLLATEPVFRATLERIEKLIQAEAGWSLINELTARGSASRLNLTTVAQPSIFAIQVGLAALIESWGIKPAAIVGHSVGEAAAAYAAGVLSLEDAVRVICRRASVMEQAAGLGTMAAAELSEEEASGLLAPYGDRLSLAAINGPRSLTFSGERKALQELGAQVQARGLFWRVLDVNYAFHSNQLDPCLAEMESAMAGIRIRPATVPIYSTVSGELGREGDYSPAYWPRNMRETVRFAPAISAMAEAGCNAFIELSPHPVLAYSIKKTLEKCASDARVLTTIRRAGDETVAMRELLAGWFQIGGEPRWNAIFPFGGRVVSLPSYAWQRDSFWIDETARTEPTRRRKDGNPAHPLLPRHLRSASPPKPISGRAKSILRRSPG